MDIYLRNARTESSRGDACDIWCLGICERAAVSREGQASKQFAGRKGAKWLVLRVMVNFGDEALAWHGSIGIKAKSVRATEAMPRGSVFAKKGRRGGLMKKWK